MSITMDMNFVEMTDFSQVTLKDNTKKVILVDDEEFNFIKKLRQQKALKAIQSFAGSSKNSDIETGLETIRALQGSVKDDFLSELLEERRQDKVRENLHE